MLLRCSSHWSPRTTVTFKEKDGKAHPVLTDSYHSKDALDAAVASGSVSGYADQFEALDGLLAALGKSAGWQRPK